MTGKATYSIYGISPSPLQPNFWKIWKICGCSRHGSRAFFFASKDHNMALTGKLARMTAREPAHYVSWQISINRITPEAIQQQYACILMDNGPLRTKNCIAIESYMYIIIKKFRNFWVCFDWPFLSNIPVQLMLDFGKSWLIVPGDWGTKFRRK